MSVICNRRSWSKHSGGENMRRELPPLYQSWHWRALASLLLFGIATEWLLPLTGLQKMTTLYSIWPLVAVLGAYLLTGLWMLERYWGALVNIALAVLGTWFYFAVFLQSASDGWLQFAGGITDDIASWLAGSWAFGAQWQTIMMLWLAGTFIVTIQHLLWLRQWGFGVLVVTALYLILLNDVLGVSVAYALLRLLAEGLLLCALGVVAGLQMGDRVQNIERLQRRGVLVGKVHFEGNSHGAHLHMGDRRGAQRWASGVLALVLFVTGVGSLSAAALGDDETGEMQVDASSLAQQMREWLTHGIWSAGEEGAQSGYGASDEILGGMLEQSDTPQLLVQADMPLYLRGESLDVYTGQGWKQAETELRKERVGAGFRAERAESVRASESVSASEAGPMSASEAQQSAASGGVDQARGIGEDARAAGTVTMRVAPLTTGQDMPLFSGSDVSYVQNLAARRGEKQRDVRQMQSYRVNPVSGGMFPLRGWLVQEYEVVSDMGMLISGSAYEKAFRVLGAAGDPAATQFFADQGGVQPGDREPDANRAAGAADTVPGSSRVDEAEPGKALDMDATRAAPLDAPLDALLDATLDATLDVPLDVPLDEALIAQYTQLPAALPERVRELSAQLWAESDGDVLTYVQRVEDYLERNYPYSLESQVPGAGQDFVDHFLFEQREGYCVHFATAMTVLLRVQGIPARYVKGFAPGERVDSSSNGVNEDNTTVAERQSDGEARPTASRPLVSVQTDTEEVAASNPAVPYSAMPHPALSNPAIPDPAVPYSAMSQVPDLAAPSLAPDARAANKPDTYVVRAQDAHAWVEVYLPQAGRWVMFDPTPGYDGAGASPALAAASSAAASPSLAQRWADTLAWARASVERTGAYAAAFMRDLTADESRWTIWLALAGITVAAAAALLLQHARVRYALHFVRYARLYRRLIRERSSSLGGGRTLAHTMSAISPSRSHTSRARVIDAYMALSALLWQRVHLRYGAPRASATAAEYVAALAPALSADQRRVLAGLIVTDDQLRFSMPYRTDQLPTPAQLQDWRRQLL
jgi:transglutaminase-like putative cysteine protease